MNKFVCFFLLFFHTLCGVNLEDCIQDFVVETKRIEIPGYPHAFNPSIIQWNGKIILTFRNIPDVKNKYISYIGIAELDKQFNVIGKPQLLDLTPEDYPLSAPSRAEDARLIQVGKDLMIVYSDNRDEKISKAGFRVHTAKLTYRNDLFGVQNVQKLTDFKGETPLLREKNWVPFVYDDRLYLSYSLEPHRVFRPIPNSPSCEWILDTDVKMGWDWGVVRGGTPGLKIDDDHYLSFFHSSKLMKTDHSDNDEVLHYFMGAYLFSSRPPFQILAMSPEPIVGPNFYMGENYKPYWHPVRAVFPCGFIFDKKHIWVTYGRQDHECWVVKLHRKRLIQSLKPL